MTTYPTLAATPWNITLKTYVDNVPVDQLSHVSVKHPTYNADSTGATDATTAIHAARDATGAAVLYFPPGTYKTTTGLVANVANQRWVLAPGAVIQAPVGSANAITVSANGVQIHGPGKVSGALTFACVFIGSGLSDVQVLGAELNGGEYGVRVKGATGPITTRVRVSGNTIHGQNDAGVFFNWECTDSEISDNQIYSTTGNGVAVDRTSTRCRVVNNAITNSGRIGIEIFSAGTGATVVGNHINTATLMGISIDTSDGCRVALNRIETAGTATGGYGIELARSNHCVIEGNYVSDSFDHGIGFACVAGGTNSDNAVIGNTILRPGGRGITATGSGGVAALRNRIIGNYVLDPVTAPAIGDDPTLTADWVIANNVIEFTTTGRTGITVNGAGFMIADNRIDYSTTITVSGGTGINVASTALNTSVTGNLVTGNGKASSGITVGSSATGCSIIGNVLRDTTTSSLNATGVNNTNIISNNLVAPTSGSAVTMGSAVGFGNYNPVDGTTKSTGPHRFDGNIGFYATTPIAQQTRAGQLTVAAGTPSTTTTTDVGAAFSQTILNNQIATLATKLNALETIVHNLGLTT